MIEELLLQVLKLLRFNLPAVIVVEWNEEVISFKALASSASDI